MALNEISEQQYKKIRKYIDAGKSDNWISENEPYGKRRVRLIRKSKSFNSYLALRRAERRKRAENTPVKAKAGKHELAQGESVVDQLIETPTKEEKAKQKAKDERRTLPPVTISVDEKEMQKLKRKQAETFANTIFYTILILALVGFWAIVWFLLTRVF